MLAQTDDADWSKKWARVLIEPKTLADAVLLLRKLCGVASDSTAVVEVSGGEPTSSVAPPAPGSPKQATPGTVQQFVEAAHMNRAELGLELGGKAPATGDDDDDAQEDAPPFPCTLPHFSFRFLLMHCTMNLVLNFLHPPLPMPGFCRWEDPASALAAELEKSFGKSIICFMQLHSAYLRANPDSMGEMLTPYERLLSFCEGKQEAEEQLGVSIDAAFLKSAAGSQCHECPGVLSYPGAWGCWPVGCWVYAFLSNRDVLYREFDGCCKRHGFVPRLRCTIEMPVNVYVYIR